MEQNADATHTADDERAADEFDLEVLLSELDDLIANATSGEDEGDAALAIRSISW